MATYILAFAAVAPVLTMTGARTAAAEDFATEGRAMVEEITALERGARVAIGRQGLDQRVMAVMAKVPRHEFVPADQIAYAYANRPLPIGHGQTISQPYIVALMTDLAKVVRNVGATRA